MKKDYQQIIDRLPEYIKKKRLKHSLTMFDEVDAFAKLYQFPVKKVKTACLLHDVARDLSDEELFEYCELNRLEISALERRQTVLLHGRVGMLIAKKHFEIDDIDILNAIQFHTTGRKGMSLVEKIVYILDFCEPTRTFPEAKVAYKMFKTDLKKTMHYCLKFGFTSLLERNRAIHHCLLEAYNELILGE